MSECCSTKKPSQQSSKKHNCPKNNRSYGQVPYITVTHHINKPWQARLTKQTYYFCDDPNCDVVYFGSDNSMICKDQIRTKVGIKEETEDAVVCYCFGILKSEAQNDIKTRAFVVEQTKNSLCSCTTHNPSGKCCLKNFP
jgi:hypothetical protein